MADDSELDERVGRAISDHRQKLRYGRVMTAWGESAMAESFRREQMEFARVAIAEVQRWRPIETAPRDGTPIIAWDAPICGEAYFETGDKQWWWTNTGPGEYTGRCIFPTQWQPLPAPPQ